MKSSILILIFFISVTAHGQKMPSDYFQEAENYFENKEIDEALETFQFIVDNYPDTELYPRAYYNIGYINFLQKNYDEAIAVFKKIVKSNFNEKEALGGGVMDDPYTNYKHRASEFLCDIYQNKGMLDKALHYLALSDTTYPYLHFCANESEAYDYYVALRYAEIYEKKGMPEKAIDKLLPNVFDFFANNKKIISELKKLLKGKVDLKQKLDSSLNNIYSKTKTVGEDHYTEYYFYFLNNEIEVPSGPFEVEYNKDKKIKKIKETDFYKMIEGL